jgi:hypothetical protein
VPSGQGCRCQQRRQHLGHWQQRQQQRQQQQRQQQPRQQQPRQQQQRQQQQRQQQQRQQQPRQQQQRQPSPPGGPSSPLQQPVCRQRQRRQAGKRCRLCPPRSSPCGQLLQRCCSRLLVQGPRQQLSPSQQHLQHSWDP